MSIETQIGHIIQSVLSLESLNDVFVGYIIHSEENDIYRRKQAIEQLRQVLSPQSMQENVDLGVRVLVNYALGQVNPKRAEIIMSLMEGIVENNIVPAKLICETLLKSEKLSYQKGDLWCMTFQLVRRIIGGVDYKGVRDMLKLLFDRLQSIPAVCNVSHLKQVKAVSDVLSYILDRNTCLLPSYFIVTEIMKLFPEGKNWPHWYVGRMFSDFVDSFKPTAQMVSFAGKGLSRLLPVLVVGYSSGSGSVWKLDPTTLRYPIRGSLPYEKEIYEPQVALVRYILEQPYSREMICILLGLNKQQKQRSPVLEEQFVDLIVIAMQRSEAEVDATAQLWQCLISNLIFFFWYQFISFPHMVTSLHEKLSAQEPIPRKGRDHLMWMLLQLISGTIQKFSLNDFLSVLKLYDLLYTERDMLPVPDVMLPNSAQQMAAACIWMHMLNKKPTPPENIRLHRPLPNALKGQIEFLSQNLRQKNLSTADYRIALLCNAYSTQSEVFKIVLSILLDNCFKHNSPQVAMPGPQCFAEGPTQPLPMLLLDALTVHAKLSLINQIVVHILQMAQSKSTLALSPALVETYSRLLVYTEIETLGIKVFIGTVMPGVFKHHAWGIMHTLLETFTYRLHHVQAHYRIQLLSHLHSIAGIPQTNQAQFHLCVENTALRIITGLGSVEVQPALSRFLQEPKTINLTTESEELNRALVLTLARSMHITGSETLSGNWCNDFLTTIMHHTPHSWSAHTLTCFPNQLTDFFHKYNIAKENKPQLKRTVDHEYQKWKTMNNENDIINHFSLSSSPNLFICILWKVILENDRIGAIAYKILERIGPRLLSSHLRTFCDYLVHEFATLGGGQQVNKCIDALNDLIWKYNVVTIDKLILCLSLRSFEREEAQVCFLIVRLLLTKPAEFKSRVTEFVKENSPEHWLQNNWHERHTTYHQKFPERYWVDDSSSQSTHTPYLPVYFSNVCLRFLPVLDLVLHRFLELPPNQSKSLENILDSIGTLYKFHDHPVTYLYNTLHYYEKRLRDRPSLKKKLLATIYGAQKESDLQNKLYVTDAYSSYMQRPIDDIDWTPGMEYYSQLVSQLVDAMSSSSQMTGIDWRFSEFSSAPAHVLHSTCVEVMGLPVSSEIVGNGLLDVVLKNNSQVNSENVESWMNAIALILTSLPDSFRFVLNTRLIEHVQKLTMIESKALRLDVFKYAMMYHTSEEVYGAYLLAVAHMVWHHCSIGQLSVLPQFIKERMLPVIQTEAQFLYLCSLVGPFLQRFREERTRCLLDLTVSLYEMLEKVDKLNEHLHHINPICDLLYHIKYMFTGDGVKAETEKIIKRLRPSLQLRLRFIAHISVEPESIKSEIT